MFDSTKTKTIHVDVTITTNHLGESWSTHDLASDVDRETALTLPTGGQEHVANALFVESLRREAILQILKRETQEGDFLQRWKQADRNQQNEMLEAMVPTIQEKIQKQLEVVPFAALWDAMLSML
jgi:hypothetical protein